MMSRKRRLSSTSLSSVSSTEHSDPLHISSESTSSILDDSTSDGGGGSSSTIGIVSPRNHKNTTTYGRTTTNQQLEEDDSHPSKKRRRGEGHLKFQKSFEGMMLDEGLNPSLSVPGCQVNLDGQSSSQWYPKPLEQPTRFYAPDTLDCRDALAPDAQGDITISCEEDVLRPQWVEQPLSAVQMPNDFQAPRMEDDSMDEDRLDGQKKNGKSWYEPEKDRIIVTSLSDSESSPSTSPRLSSPILDLPSQPTDTIIDLDSLSSSHPNDSSYHQPGPGGFTISPSFLSRLNKYQLQTARGYEFGFPADYQGEKGLIMYRTPIGVDGTMRRERSQSGIEDEDDDRLDLGARIEEIDDDDGEMDVMDGRQSRGDDQMDMDVDSGLVDEVESMDIG